MIKDLKIEVRVLGALLALALGGTMLIDALRIMSTQTMVSKVAYLSSFPDALVAYWIFASALVVPYFLTQTFNVFEKHHEHCKRLACWAVMAGGVLYAYMAFLSRNLDFKYVTAIFLATSFLNICVAAALAYSINRAQIRREDGQV